MKTALKVALGAVAWLVVIELGCYAYLRSIHNKHNVFLWYLESMVDHFHPLWHEEGGEKVNNYYPYVGVFLEGDWSRTKPPREPYPDGWVLPTDVDAEGRQRYVTPEKEPGTIRVVTIGSSQMTGLGESAPDKYVSNRLGQLLREANPGRRIEVVNASFYTFIATQEMEILATKMCAFHPDLVVVVDGFADFARAYFTSQLPPYWGQHQEFLYKTFKRTQSFKGTLAQLAYLTSKRFYCLAMIRAYLFSLDRQGGAAVDAGPAKTLDPGPYHRMADEYMAMVKNTRGVAQAQGIPILQVLQPTLSFRKPMSDRERSTLDDWDLHNPHYKEAAAIFFPEIEKRFRSFAAEVRGRSSAAVNMSGLYEGHPETVYSDHCHYNDAGADILARALFPRVAGMLGLKGPSGS